MAMDLRGKVVNKKLEYRWVASQNEIIQVFKMLNIFWAASSFSRVHNNSIVIEWTSGPKYIKYFENLNYFIV